MKLNKHLLILIPGFASDTSDDTCIPLLQALFKSYREMHPEMHISLICMEYPFRRDRYDWHGIDVYSMGGKNSKIFKLFNWLKAMKLANEINKQRKIDIVHSFWLDQCAFIGQRLSTKWKVPHFTTLMGQDAKPDNKYLKLLPLKDLNLIALSTFQANVFKNHSGINITEINPIGLRKEDIPTKASPEKKIDVLGVGSLIPLKNYELFIEVIEQLIPNFPNIKTCIVGGGPQLQYLSDLVASKGLQNNIELTGLIPRKEVLQKMSQSRIFLHTSSYESQGYVFYEALAHGCKVVSKDIGVAESSSYWKIAEDKEGLANSVVEFFENNSSIDPNYRKIEETVNQNMELYAQV